MSLKARVKKTGNKFQNLIKKLHQIDGDSVEVGHFKSQGTHASGFTYAELMAIHHNGGNPDGSTPLPPRPVLKLLSFKNAKLSDPKFKVAFKAWGNRPLSRSSNDLLLESIGKILRDKEKAIFGSSELAPNAVPPKARNSPLVDTGDLRSKTAYKISSNKTVQEGS